MKLTTLKTNELLEKLWKNGFRNCGNQVGGRTNDKLETEAISLINEILERVSRAEDMGYGQGYRRCEQDHKDKGCNL